MTFEDLNSELPNGFHDARLHGIVIDYVAGRMSLRLDVWVGNLDGPDREKIARQSCAWRVCVSARLKYRTLGTPICRMALL